MKKYKTEEQVAAYNRLYYKNHKEGMPYKYKAKKYRKEQELIWKLWHSTGWFIIPEEKLIKDEIIKEELLDEDTIDDVSLEDCIENDDEDDEKEEID